MGYEEVTFEKDSVFLVTDGASFVGSNVAKDLLKNTIKAIFLRIAKNEYK